MSAEVDNKVVKPVERFRTDRTIATRVTDDDYEELCVLHADAQTMVTLGGVRDRTVTRRFLDEKLAHWEQYGHGLWVFRDPDSGVFVARGLLEHIEIGGAPEVELGYTVMRDRWGMGYATEMARAMLCIGFSTLDLTSIVAFTYPDNFGSRRVMEKNGLTYERAVEHVGRTQVLYRIRRSGYASDLCLRHVDGDIVVA